MKTLSIDEFSTIAKQGDWAHEIEIETLHREDVLDFAGEETGQVKVSGSATLTSTLAGLSVTYLEGWSYIEGNVSSFSTSVEGLPEPLLIEGFEILDEDGLDADLVDVFSDHDIDVAFCTINYDGLKQSI